MGTGLKGKIVLQNAMLGAGTVCIHTSSGFMMVCERATRYKRLSVYFTAKERFSDSPRVKGFQRSQGCFKRCFKRVHRHSWKHFRFSSVKDLWRRSVSFLH